MTGGNNKIQFEALKARRENLALVVVGGGAKGTILKLFHERWRGESYLGSVAGRGYVSRLQVSAVEGFKKSPEFEKACMARALALWDDVFKDYQTKLRDSGLAWDDVIKLLG